MRTFSTFTPWLYLKNQSNPREKMHTGKGTMTAHQFGGKLE